jgi:hypothetical protein
MYLVDGMSLHHIVIFSLCDRICICFGWKETIKVETGTYYCMVGDAYVYAIFELWKLFALKAYASWTIQCQILTVMWK